MMGRLQVRPKNKLATLTKGFLHMQTKSIHKVIFMVEHRQVILADQLLLTPKSAGSQYRGNRNLVKIDLNETPFTIRRLIRKPVHNGFREMPCVNSYTAVLIFFAINEIGFIPFWDEI